MIRTIGSLAAAAFLFVAGAQAATTQTTLTVTASGSFGTTGSITATGTATLSGIGSGTFSATLSLTSVDSSGNLSAPYTITLSGGNITGTLKVPESILSGATNAAGSATVTGGTGTYANATGSFTLTGSGTLTSTLAISLGFSGPGSITTGGTSSGGGGTPAPTITAVFDAASNTAGVAQGTIFIVKGSNLCPSGTNFFNVPRPTVAPNGVKITFTPTSGGAGTDALLWYEYNPSGTCQLAGILQSTVAAGNYNVTVTNGTASAPFAVQVLAHKFALFTQDSSGAGLASAQNVISQTQVDLNSFTTGTGKGTTISPAHPGQYMVVYGTGMGAYSAGDNAASPIYDFTKNGVTVNAIVGGMTIPVLYAGLAGYAGEDQINFQLPSNVPTGCTVSLQISVNGTMSNATFIAIAPDTASTACVQPGFTTSQLQNLDNGGTYTVGGFALSNISETIPQFGTTNFAEIGGAFTTYTGYQLLAAASSNVTTSTIGACTIYTITGTASAVVSTGSGTSLDAGTVTISGPSGSGLSNTALTDTNNAYSLTIGSIGGITIPGSVNGTIVAGTYNLNGAGGKDVGKFNASVTIGTPLTVTGGLPSSITRSAGYTLNWTGGLPTDYVEIIGSSSGATGSTATEFICTTTAAPGTFTIPSAVLTQLPVSAANGGFLEVASTPNVTNGNLLSGNFTAPLTAGGSVTGYFFAFSGIGGIVTYQ